MPFQATTATHKLLKLKKRIKLIPGGTSGGKTISILQILIDKSQTDTTPKLTSIVSESFPHLKRGAMRDFKNIMQEHGYWEPKRWNATDYTYTFPLVDENLQEIPGEGSKIEFFSADQPSKVRGPRRNRLFVNEANNVDQEAWEQLLLRTDEEAWADWNPVSDFYMYEEYGINDEAEVPVADDPRADVCILTYKDNEALSANIVEEIERRASLNKQWARVYAKGLRGETEGKIFKGWKIIDEIPHEARLEVRGLDFGYARDPMALCDIYYYNGGYIIDELACRVGMLNRHTADLILNQPDPNVLTIADSAEAKSIAEMAEYGVNIVGVQKRGSGGLTFTNSAIQFVQEQRMSVTKRSINFIKSYRNFMWQTDKDGNTITKYDHYLSDPMMAVVYGMTNFSAVRDDDDDDTQTTGNITSLWG